MPLAILYTGDDLEAGTESLEANIVSMLGNAEYDIIVLSWYKWTVESGNFEGSYRFRGNPYVRKSCCAFLILSSNLTGNFVQAWTGFLRPEKNTMETWRAIEEALVPLLKETAPNSMTDIELFGGAISSSALPEETAFPYRDARWNAGLLLMVPVEEGLEVYERNVALVNAAWPKIRKYLDCVYLNYPMESLTNEEYPRQYWGDNLERLMKLKAKYDPMNVFNHPQSVPLP